MQTPISSILMFIVAALFGALRSVPLQSGCGPYDLEYQQLSVEPAAAGGRRVLHRCHGPVRGRV